MSRMAELWQAQLDELDGQDYDDCMAYQAEQQRIKEQQQLTRVSEATASTH